MSCKNLELCCAALKKSGLNISTPATEMLEYRRLFKCFLEMGFKNFIPSSFSLSTFKELSSSNPTPSSSISGSRKEVESFSVVASARRLPRNTWTSPSTHSSIFSAPVILLLTRYVIGGGFVHKQVLFMIICILMLPISSPFFKITSLSVKFWIRRYLITYSWSVSCHTS